MKRTRDLINWKDNSSSFTKAVAIQLINGVSLKITQDYAIQDLTDNLWTVTVFDKSGNIMKDYLDSHDVYIDEPNGDFRCLLLLSQVEKLVVKLSKLVF